MVCGLSQLHVPFGLVTNTGTIFRQHSTETTMGIQSLPLRLRKRGCGLRSPPDGGRDWPVPQKVNMVQTRYNLTQMAHSVLFITGVTVSDLCVC